MEKSLLKLILACTLLGVTFLKAGIEIIDEAIDYDSNHDWIDQYGRLRRHSPKPLDSRYLYK